ncbi:MAG: YveK family protein [Sarcina sp.]
MNEEVIKIEDLLYALKKRWKIIALITIVTTLIAGVLSFVVIKPKYETQVKVFIGKEEKVGEDSAYNSNDISMYQKLMKTYAEIIKTNDLIKSGLKDIQQNSDMSNVQRVKSGLSVMPSSDTQIMVVKYTSADKSEIVPVINSITDTFMSKSKDLIPNGNVQIIEAAQMPQNPISPNKTLNIIIGFALGLMISIGLSFLLEYLDNTVRTKSELESLLGVPVIGAIPNMDKK